MGNGDWGMGNGDPFPGMEKKIGYFELGNGEWFWGMGNEFGEWGSTLGNGD